MRSNTATTRRVRLVIVLSVAAAATVMLGIILVAVSVVMRLLTKGQPADMARLGLDMVAAGIAFGLVVLVVFALARIGTAGRPRRSGRKADHGKGASQPQPAQSRGPGKSPGHGRARGNGKERLRAGAPPAGGGRSARPLNPTNVYTPGGLIDVPRDGRAPGTPGGQAVPEILRTAGPPPASGASAPGATGGWGQDRPSPARARSHPAPPGYQPGMPPGGPGRGAYAVGGQPPSVPPRENMRPREAPRPGPAMPPREPVPARGAASSSKPRSGHAAPPRDSRLLRDAGPPREGMGPGGPIRPGGPAPPAYPSPPGQEPRQGGGSVRHAGGPGYAGAGGYRPGPGYAGSGGSAEAPEPFDGGYAKVIRASDHPIRPPGPARSPGPGRLSDPVPPAAPPADVYVYRDTDGLPGDSGSPAPGPDENDPAYWYDLPVTGSAPSGGPDQPGGVPHGLTETRGPFEPLVSSADPPGTPPRISASAGASAEAGDGGDAGPAPDAAHPAEADPAGEGPQDSSHARKLEQIKEMYLTAEAIGEANVDKHFDQLLAQQRELISEYFSRPGADSPAADPAGLAEDEPGSTRPPGAPAGPPGGAHVAADQPRAW